MIAALPMYDRPENAWAHDALWARVRDGLRARGLAAPDALDRLTPHDETWGRPDLLLGQICNLPWRARHRDRVIVATADHGLPGAAPGLYHSWIVARASDTRPLPVLARRFAVNDALSNSGWDAAQRWAAAEGIALHPTLRTGSHRLSARAVATGAADLASIDAVSWRGILRWDPEAAALRVLAPTPATPGMTFIAAPGTDPAPLREALAGAIAAATPEERDALLGLRGLADLPASAYDIPLPPAPTLPAAS